MIPVNTETLLMADCPSATCLRMNEMPTPITDEAEISMDRRDLTPIAKLPEFAKLARTLERELERSLTREAAIIRFCECEMGWEFFRAEFQIGDNPSRSMENAIKLRAVISKSAQCQTTPKP